PNRPRPAPAARGRRPGGPILSDRRDRRPPPRRAGADHLRAEAEAHFGFRSALVALDNPTSSASTRELRGQQPTHPDLLADLDEGHHFEAWHGTDRRRS